MVRGGDRRRRGCGCVIRTTCVWVSKLKAEGTRSGFRVVTEIMLRRVHGWIADRLLSGPEMKAWTCYEGMECAKGGVARRLGESKVAHGGAGAGTAVVRNASEVGSNVENSMVSCY